MTEAAAPVATPAAAPEAVARPSVEDRAAALKVSLSEPSESSAETSTAASPPVADGASPSAADSAGSDAKAKERADRLERIAAMTAQVKAKERQQDAERQQRRQQKQEAGEVEKLRAKLAELEPLNNVFASEEALLEAAEQKGMSAEKLVAWMRQRLTDPTAIATQKAKSEADKVREEMAALRKQLEDEKAAAQEAAEKARFEAASIQRANTFVEQVSASPRHPLAAAFLKKHGPKGLIAYANHFVTPMLPEHYEISHLHDSLEQLLEETQLGAPDVSATGTSQPPKKNGADKPITTLSNAIGSERSTAVEDIPLHKLSREERKRLLKEKLANE